MPVCLRGGGEAEQIEGAVLCAGGCGEDGGEVIAAEADDIAGERGEIAKQGVEAVHRERFQSSQRRSDFGDIIGRLARKFMAANAVPSHVFLGELNASSTNRPVA